MDEIEFLVQEGSDQKVFDLSELVTSISYSHEFNKVSKLSFSYLKAAGRMFTPGSIIRFRYNKQPIFYGFIFETTHKHKTIEVVAYDQLRYLKAKDTLMYESYTVGKLIKVICGRVNVKPGNIADTGFVLPNKVIRNKTYIDMITDGISDTLIGTKKKFIIRDDYGSIGLHDVETLKLPLIFGDESFVYGYSYKRSIDGETYNRIKLAQKKDKTLDQSCIAEDTSNQKRWGILQYYDEVDENISPALVKKKAQDLLKRYNQEERSFSISCIGDTRVRAGSGINILLSNLGINHYFLVDKVSHKFTKNKIHTMEVELKL